MPWFCFGVGEAVGDVADVRKLREDKRWVADMFVLGNHTDHTFSLHANEGHKSTRKAPTLTKPALKTLLGEVCRFK